MVNLTFQELQGLNIYEQYSKDKVYFDFFLKLKQYIYNNYFQDLEKKYNLRFIEYVENFYNLDSLDSDSFADEKTINEAREAIGYLMFYYTHFFGFYSPLGKAGGNVLYDDNEKWESDIQWDDVDGNGFIPIKDYLKIIKYFLNYKFGSWTYGWLYSLIIDYANTDKFVFEPTENGVNVFCVNDSKGKLKILGNIFTDFETYTFTPIQRVKFVILYSDEELQKEIERIQKETPPINQEETKPPIDNTKPLTELELNPINAELEFKKSIEVSVSTNAENYNVINKNPEKVYLTENKEQNKFIVKALTIVGNAQIEVKATAKNSNENIQYFNVLIKEPERLAEVRNFFDKLKGIFTYSYKDNPNNLLPIDLRKNGISYPNSEKIREKQDELIDWQNVYHRYYQKGQQDSKEAQDAWSKTIEIKKEIEELTKNNFKVDNYTGIFHYFFDLDKEQNIERFCDSYLVNYEYYPIEYLKKINIKLPTDVGNLDLSSLDFGKDKTEILKDMKELVKSGIVAINKGLSVTDDLQINNTNQSLGLTFLLLFATTYKMIFTYIKENNLIEGLEIVDGNEAHETLKKDFALFINTYRLEYFLIIIFNCYLHNEITAFIRVYSLKLRQNATPKIENIEDYNKLNEHEIIHLYCLKKYDSNLTIDKDTLHKWLLNDSSYNTYDYSYLNETDYKELNTRYQWFYNYQYANNRLTEDKETFKNEVAILYNLIETGPKVEFIINAIMGSLVFTNEQDYKNAGFNTRDEFLNARYENYKKQYLTYSKEQIETEYTKLNPYGDSKRRNELIEYIASKTYETYSKNEDYALNFGYENASQLVEYLKKYKYAEYQLFLKSDQELETEYTKLKQFDTIENNNIQDNQKQENTDQNNTENNTQDNNANIQDEHTKLSNEYVDLYGDYYMLMLEIQANQMGMSKEELAEQQGININDFIKQTKDYIAGTCKDLSETELQEKIKETHEMINQLKQGV